MKLSQFDLQLNFGLTTKPQTSDFSRSLNGLVFKTLVLFPLNLDTNLICNWKYINNIKIG